MNREKVVSFLTSPQATSYIDSVRSIFTSVPHIPYKVKDILVQIIPWLMIVGAILSAINGLEEILYAFGVNRIGNFVDNDIYLFLSGVLDLVAAYIGFLAFPLLRSRNYTGWVLLFWNTVLSVIMSALTLLLGLYAVLGVVLTAVIGFYLTFEVEELYTLGGKVPSAATEMTEKTAKKITKPAKKSVVR